MGEQQVKQGIMISGVLANIKQVEKTFEGKTTRYQTLQITVLNDDGLSLIDVKDKDFIFDCKDKLNKPINISVAYSVMNDKAYFRLI